MFQLIRYDCEDSITVMGYYDSHKEAYESIFADIIEWGEYYDSKFVLPEYENIQPDNYDNYMYSSLTLKEVGICYYDAAAFWGDFDAWYQIVELPSMKMNSSKAKTYTDTLRTVISFLRENEEYGDDWSEEIKNLDSLLDEIK